MYVYTKMRTKRRSRKRKGIRQEKRRKWSKRIKWTQEGKYKKEARTRGVTKKSEERDGRDKIGSNIEKN